MTETTETAGQFLQRVGCDAKLWAEEFNKTAKTLGYSDMDEGWLIGWFANAIENTCVTRKCHTSHPTPDNRWPDPLESPQARAIRNGKIDDVEICNLFDRMQREILVHRMEFCEPPKPTPEPAVGVKAPPPGDLAERCQEILAWKKTGVLHGETLRSLARQIRDKFGNVFDTGEALQHAEDQTKRQAMEFVIAALTSDTQATQEPKRLRPEFQARLDSVMAWADTLDGQEPVGETIIAWYGTNGAEWRRKDGKSPAEMTKPLEYRVVSDNTQAAQEPVAYISQAALDSLSAMHNGIYRMDAPKWRTKDTNIPLYAAPPAPQAPFVPEGWQLVPRIATKRMLPHTHAGQQSYERLLAAAPQPSQPAADGIQQIAVPEGTRVIVPMGFACDITIVHPKPDVRREAEDLLAVLDETWEAHGIHCIPDTDAQARIVSRQDALRLALAGGTNP